MPRLDAPRLDTARVGTLLSLVAAALLGGPAFGAATVVPSVATRNILVLVADDMGVEQLAAYGEGLADDYPATPAIDSLAQQGVLFRNCWSYPLCTPTRATLMTGRYGFRSQVGSLLHFQGQALPVDEVILPEMLDLGTGGAYAHAVFGKWHLANGTVGGDQAVNLAGWSHFEGPSSTNFPSYYDWIKVTNGVSAPSNVYHTTDVVDSALAWVGQQTSPWLAYLAFVAPHNPLHAPPAELHSIDLTTAGTPQADPRPYYKAMIEAMDFEIARLLDGLGPALADTVVVFVADNGTQADAASFPHGPNEVKGTVFEGGINVPLIVTGPPVTQPGSESSALVSTVDLFATVADIAGVNLATALPAGTELDSLSLVPYLVDPALGSQRDVVFSEWFSPNGPGAHAEYKRTARNATYKLTQRSFGPDQLFHLGNDPLEDVDLLESELSTEDAQALAALSVAIDDLLLPWPAAIFPYGCGLNPPQSLAVLSPAPVIGQDLALAVDNPYSSQFPGSVPLVAFSLLPDPSYPCGLLIPGLGMAEHGIPGELLVDVTGATFFVGPAWAGPGQPAELTAPIPNASALLDVPVYVQGFLFGAPGSDIALGLTSAFRLQFVE